MILEGICDSHMHVGQFYNDYYSPKFIIKLCKKNNVKAIAVSSTTTCDENCDKVIQEIRSLQEQHEVLVKPILWVLPNMFSNGNLHKLLNCNIEWSCIKIHNYQQQGRWGDPMGEQMLSLVELAQDLSVPILFHTGDDYCLPIDYQPLVQKFSQQIFIFAHSRPLDQTIKIMKENNNVWCDTAFVPPLNIRQLIDSGLISRVLFGTDMPIYLRYRKYSVFSPYRKIVKDIHRVLSKEEWKKISLCNFEKIYCQ